MLNFYWSSINLGVAIQKLVMRLHPTFHFYYSISSQVEKNIGNLQKYQCFPKPNILFLLFGPQPNLINQLLK